MECHEGAVLMAGFISPLAGPSAPGKPLTEKSRGHQLHFRMGSAIGSPKVPKSVAFQEAYAKQFGSPIEAGHGPGPAYDSVYILPMPIQRAGKHRCGRHCGGIGSKPTGRECSAG